MVRDPGDAALQADDLQIFEFDSSTWMPPTSKACLTSKATMAKYMYVRHLANAASFDDRGISILWKLLKPLYGEVDAGRIWHRTAKKQLIQGFTQSEFD
eukprot:1804847-Pleurochrysis_carterae.AAC.1